MQCLLLFGLGSFLCSCVLGADQGQKVFRVEGVLTLGLLSRGTQDDIYAPVTGQDNRAHVLEHLLPLLFTQLGILLNRFSHVVVAQILFFAKGLDLNVLSGNALSDQEALCSIYTPLREDLVVLGGATRVGMSFESQVGFRLAPKILFEIAGQRNEDLLLAIEHAAGRIAERRPARLKVDAVEGKPRFELRDLS